MFSRLLANPKPGERWLLVTSAYHMPRAMAAFRAAGFPVEAYPVDWRTRGPIDAVQPFGSLGEGLRRTDTAVHEWVGLLAYRLTGRTAELFPGALIGVADLRMRTRRRSTPVYRSFILRRCWRDWDRFASANACVASLARCPWGNGRIMSTRYSCRARTPSATADRSRGSVAGERWVETALDGAVHRGGGAVRILHRGRDRPRDRRLESGVTHAARDCATLCRIASAQSGLQSRHGACI